MKFGRRFVIERARCWPDACVDYKAAKRALKHDLAAGDALAAGFLKQLLAELAKVSSFYVQQATALEACLAQHVAAAAADGSSSDQPPAADLAALRQLRADIKQLIKFVALNYLSVVKIIKKRNKHVRAAFGADSVGPPLHPMDLLRQEVFFSSPRLAALATHAELLEAAAAAAAGGGGADGPAAAPAAPAAAAGGAVGAVELEDYQCPICLDVLRSPVVLNCTHRLCWGCCVAHAAASTGPTSHHHQHEQQQQPGEEASGGTADATLPQQKDGGGCSQQQQPGATTADATNHSSSSSSVTGKGLVVLEKLVADAGGSSNGSSSSDGSECYYSCPVCRQPQVVDIDSLAVDPHLAEFVDELRLRMRPDSSSTTSSATPAAPLSAASRSSSLASSSTLSTVTVELSRSPSSISVASELPALPPAADACAQQQEVASSPAAAVEPEQQEQHLLPRQLPCHAGRLCVLLDLDGTLISSFTPRRAPALPRSMRTHLVGVGSALNPAGVFVVERPGLAEFLTALAGLAEVVVFTAGLQEYAEPIIDAIDPAGCISARLYRPACMKTEHHSCVKDLRLLGRPLSRTVLVDDTPLAFLHQPECGVPVLGFRGDPDDRLLVEAVFPLIQTLAGAPDIRPVLHRRFEMVSWFRRHGFPEALWMQPQRAQRASSSSLPAATSSRQPLPATDLEVLVEEEAEEDAEGGVCPAQQPLLVFDWDRTLTEWDAGERLVSELAPELLPWLQGLESPANFVPITNEILAEAARRGVSRDRLLAALHHAGAELPGPSVRLLRWAKGAGLPVVVLSDCNAVFIKHMLAGAKLAGCVDELITNGASFERVVAAAAGGGGGGGVGLGSLGSSSTGKAGAGSPSAFKLVIEPRQAESHGCPLCPANLCKGRELQRLLAQRRAAASAAGGSKPGARGRVVYAGDGANDVCPALLLGPSDVVLARAGAALARYAERARADPALRPLRAAVHVWDSHAQLARLVQQHAQRRSGGCGDGDGSA